MAVSAHENMTMIAVGFKDGTAIVIRGNITRDRMSRHRIVHEEREPRPGVYVTGEHGGRGEGSGGCVVVVVVVVVVVG